MSAGKTTPVQPRPDSSPGCPPLLLAGHPDPADRSGSRAAGRTPPRWADPGRPHGCVRSGGADRDGSVITSKRRAPALVRGCRTGPRPAGGVVRRRGDVVGPGCRHGSGHQFQLRIAAPFTPSCCRGCRTCRGSPVPVAHRGPPYGVRWNGMGAGASAGRFETTSRGRRHAGAAGRWSGRMRAVPRCG